MREQEKKFVKDNWKDELCLNFSVSYDEQTFSLRTRAPDLIPFTSIITISRIH